MARAQRICPKPGCPKPASGRYCDKHNREYERARGTREQRGYGVEHKKLRRQLAAKVQAGGIRCGICGKPIPPGSVWHLDHTEDRTDYRGPAHASCNTADGGRRAHN